MQKRLMKFLAVLLVLISLSSNAATIPVNAWIETSYSGYVSNNQLFAVPRATNINIGVNAAAWDSNMLDSNYPSLLKSAGVQMLRYPGGSTADNFHWYNQSVTYPSSTGVYGSGNLGSNGVTGVNFDQFMNVVQQVGAQAMITVNYGTGTPQEAAAWVTYANMSDQIPSGHGGTNASALGAYAPTYVGNSGTGHAYGVQYWEIGNEVYGNGSYYNGSPGSDWEADNHLNAAGTTRALGPEVYAAGVVAYSKAMKAAEPSIKIGAVVTAPSNWPTGTTSTAEPATNTGVNVSTPAQNYSDSTNTLGAASWTNEVLLHACSSIDFVDVHWYAQSPGSENDATLLASPQHGSNSDDGASIASMMQNLQSAINKYCGAHASAIQIFVTETNSVAYNPGRQTVTLTNALFEADDVLTWLENGATNVDWWAAHDSPFDGATTDQATGMPLYGAYNFGDYGILSVGGTTADGVQEPAAETPFPSYYGMEIVSYMFNHNAQWATDQTFTRGALIGASNVTTTGGLSGSIKGAAIDGIDPGLLSIHSVEFTVTNSYGTSTQDHLFVDNVLLINKDPNNSYDVTINDFDCFQAGGAVGSFTNQGTNMINFNWTYGESQILAPTATPIFTRFRGSQPCSLEVIVPPYTMNLSALQGTIL